MTKSKIKIMRKEMSNQLPYDPLPISFVMLTSSIEISGVSSVCACIPQRKPQTDFSLTAQHTFAFDGSSVAVQLKTALTATVTVSFA